MKKLMATLLLTFAFSTINFGEVYANTCIQQADACYAKCDDRWGGDTFWDGAGRNTCKLGCAIAEFSCIVESWF